MKLLDGGITDSIPLTAAFKLGFERNIVVQTRPEGYCKKPARTGWLAKMFYGKYPKFVEAIKQRHLMYNRELDEIEQMRCRAGSGYSAEPFGKDRQDGAESGNRQGNV